MTNSRFDRRCFLKSVSGATLMAGLPISAFAQKATLEMSSVEIVSVRDTQHSAQLALAIESGYFADEGLQVVPNYSINGPDLPSLAASGRISVLCAAMEHLAALYVKKVDFKWVMKLSDISNTQGVVIRKNAGIKTPADLAGKRMGMYTGASVELAVLNMCKQYGVEYGSIQVVNMEPPEQALALMRGDIDVMACWEPYVSNAEKAGGRLYFTGGKSYIENAEQPVDVNWLYLATCLAASQEMIQKAPNTLRAIMRAMLRANDAINGDPDAAAVPIAKHLGLPPQSIPAILRTNVYDPVMDQRLLEGYDAYIRWAVDKKYVDEFVPLQNVVDLTLSKELVPGAVQL